MNERELLWKSNFLLVRVCLLAKYAELLSLWIFPITCSFMEHFYNLGEYSKSWPSNLFDPPNCCSAWQVVRGKSGLIVNIFNQRIPIQNDFYLIYSIDKNYNNFSIFSFHKVHMYPYFPSQCCLSVPLLIPRSRLPCVNFSC